MNEIKKLRRVRKILTRLLETCDMGTTTEYVDRALDQVNYALEDLDEDPNAPEEGEELQEDEV